jgi:hypothetical protein
MPRILNATLATSNGDFSVIPRLVTVGGVSVDWLYVAINRYDPYSSSTAILFEGRSDAYNNWGDMEERLTTEARREAGKVPRPNFVFMIGVCGRLSRFFRFQRSSGEVTYMAYTAANGSVNYDSIPTTYDITTRSHHTAIKALLRTIRDVTYP